ncbi:hypothetical protein HGRIS_006880 [Hohenbuehelia grisea]|uniref:DNA-directed DNA polymerase n=1 Tax=Hohenbuehelia grisea TaxID=104357 RepID=A0ABR3JAX9_9AGAR
MDIDHAIQAFSPPAVSSSSPVDKTTLRTPGDSSSAVDVSMIEDVSLFTEGSFRQDRRPASPASKLPAPVKNTKKNFKTGKQTAKPRKYVHLQPQPDVQISDDPQPPSSPIENINSFALSTSYFAPQATSTQRDEVLKEVGHKAARPRDKVIKIDRPSVPQPSKHPATARSSSPSTPASGSGVSLEASVSVGPIKRQARSAIHASAVESVKSKPPQEKGKKTAKKPTPYEFAVTLIENAAARMAQRPDAKPKHSQYLKGKCIFYCGGDNLYASESTRNKMTLILRHGGTLLPVYDPAITTHIVTDGAEAVTLRNLGLKSLKDIPEHIPAVRWGWVAAGRDRRRRSENQGREEYELEMDDCVTNAAFHIRHGLRAHQSRGKLKQGSKGKEKAKPEQDTTATEDGQARHSEPSTILYVMCAAPKAMLAAYHSRGILILNKSCHREFTQTMPAGRDAVSVPETSKQALVSPPPSPKTRPPPAATTASSSASASNDLNNDPLAEFYAQARAQRDNVQSGSEASDDLTDDEDVKHSRGPAPRRGWTCDKKETQRNTCVNQDIIDKLQELMELHKAKPGSDDRWRVFSYGKCIRALKNHPTRIKTLAEARSIRGVGEKTAQKIMEILNTGDLQRIKYERSEDVTVTHIFQGIYGVGQSTAWKWYANGCRSLQDVKTGVGGVKLSPAQAIGLKFYDGQYILIINVPEVMIRLQISTPECQEARHSQFSILSNPSVCSRTSRLASPSNLTSFMIDSALSIDPDLFIEIMGSFRRGKATCGDIDVMITRDPKDGRTHAGVVKTLLGKLHDAGIVTEDLALPDESDELECVYRGLCRLPAEGSKRRRLDILAVAWESRGAALLYYTGDDIFNRAMRLKANYMGYSLNQRGLFRGVVRDPRDRRVKTNKGTMIASETEEEIFKILGVPWQEPHERVRG